MKSKRKQNGVRPPMVNLKLHKHFSRHIKNQNISQDKIDKGYKKVKRKFTDYYQRHGNGDATETNIVSLEPKGKLPRASKQNLK